MLRPIALQAAAAVVLYFAAVAGSSGCGGDEPSRDAPFTGGPTVPSGLDVATLAVGASAVIPASIGYAVTASSGPTYRLVWTGRSAADRFFGSVYTTGRFALVDPGCAGFCSLGDDDIIGQPVALDDGGQRVDFDAITAVEFEGFDFVVDGADSIVLDLQVNGVREPSVVFFPALGEGSVVATVNPSAVPFALRPSAGAVGSPNMAAAQR